MAAPVAGIADGADGARLRRVDSGWRRDNAAEAETHPAEIGSPANVGHYTAGSTVDPNRQFPKLGRGFDLATPVDARGRPIEPANIALLELIDRFRPSRIVNLHAAALREIFLGPPTASQ